MVSRYENIISLLTSSSIFYFINISDNIPETIYRELPPKLQQEVQLDTRRVSN